MSYINPIWFCKDEPRRAFPNSELVAIIEYRAGIAAIRFFGSHAEYDKIDAETV